MPVKVKVAFTVPEMVYVFENRHVLGFWLIWQEFD
jgi:hypothetical protein